jgi:hypothetical protein
VVKVVGGFNGKTPFRNANKPMFRWTQGILGAIGVESMPRQYKVYALTPYHRKNNHCSKAYSTERQEFGHLGKQWQNYRVDGLSFLTNQAPYSPTLTQ